MGQTTQTRVRELMEEILTRDEHFIVDVTVRGRSGSLIVEVFLDGDSGISIRDLAAYSRELAFVLETEDVVRGKYHLNVSSPGEERCLMLPRQYARHEGRQLVLDIGADNETEVLEGTHAGINETGRLILETATGTREVDLSTVTSARITLPW